jgi:hypothetical protein
MRRGKKTPENSTKIIFGSFSADSLAPERKHED